MDLASLLSNFEQIPPSSLILTVVGALAMAAIVVLLMGALGRQRESTDARGKRGPAPSDLERLFGPLMGAIIRRRAGGKGRLKRELGWTGSRLTPEIFTALPFVLAPAGILVGLALGTLVGADLTISGLFAAGFAVVGWFFIPSRHNAAIRGRRKAAHEDAVIFMGQYARTAMTTRDMPTILAEMNKYVLQERLRFAARAALRVNRRARSSYDSAVWVGLSQMMERGAQGLVREGATLEDPDLLQQFAIYCDDYDMANFLVHLRNASIQHRSLDPKQLDAEVRELRAARIDEVKASWARLTTEATVFLVLFNLPVLFAVILGPFVAPYLPVFFSGGI
jgi:hypothetical protein